MTETRLMNPQTDNGTLMERLDFLASYSDEPDKLTRLFLSPSHRLAADQVAAWMESAGMRVHLDAAASIVGRYEAAESGEGINAKTILIGSHIDTVRDGGRYDGALGVMVGIELVRRLNNNGERLPFAIEIIAFGDEEGVRFPTTMTGSRALAGEVSSEHMAALDDDGVCLSDALDAFGGEPSKIASLARNPDDILAFLEVHIEQGPVLEARDLPVGIVTAINGASRLSVEIKGLAGHAGTVPMDLRHDALAAAAEIVLAIEARAKGEPDIVATVGRLQVAPDAINVIPGKVTLSVDLRAPDDQQRARARADIETAINNIASKRGVGAAISKMFDADAAPCQPIIMDGLASALEARQIPVLKLPSGAGHDAMTMASLCPIGMLFVRCKDGVSHNPAESIKSEDAEIATSVLLDFLRNLTPGR